MIYMDQHILFFPLLLIADVLEIKVPVKFTVKNVPHCRKIISIIGLTPSGRMKVELKE